MKFPINDFLSSLGILVTVIRLKNFAIPVFVLKKLNHRRKLDFMNSLRPVQNGFKLIRIGGAGDGGYLIPDDLDGVNFCFSPGVGLLWNFEKDLGENYGVRSFLLDSLDARPNNLAPFCNYTLGFLATKSSSPSKITLEEWLRNKIASGENELILQMDIEQSEWDILLAVSQKTLRRFRILVIEFHGLEGINHPRKLNSIFRPVIRKLSKDFEVVHFHPNNCCGYVDGFTFPKVAEITFHNKLRRVNTGYETTNLFRTTPHKLDCKNQSHKSELYVEWPIN